MSKNSFEALAKLALYVCTDPGNPPVQWIYAVDDAWLHYGVGDSPANGLQALYREFVCTQYSNKCTPSDIDTILRSFTSSGSNGTSGGTHSFALSTMGSVASPVEHPDAPVGRKLLEFVKQQARYGVCFCTFEYLWRNISEVNRKENAVFFDIKHRLASDDKSSGLCDPTNGWPAIFPKLSVSGGATVAGSTGSSLAFVFDPDLLGFHLFFAFKLGWIPGANKCEIDPNHLLILSSNIFGESYDGVSPEFTASPRVSALQAYLMVQKTVWDAIGSTDVSRYKGLDFAMLPVPKNSGDSLFDKALEIFDNTFKDASSFEVKRTALADDMEIAWQMSPPGHFSVDNYKSSALRSTSWWINDGEDWRDLRALYHVAWKPEKDTSIRVIALTRFLRYLCDVDTVKFREPDAVSARTCILLPTCPGILFGLALAKFLRALADKKDDPARSVPEILWTTTGTTMTMIVSLASDEAIRNLASGFLGVTPGGEGSESLRAVSNAQYEILNEYIGERRIRDIGRSQMVESAFHKTANSTKVRQGRTCPMFVGNGVQFYFHIIS